jgi:hypothetical protein
MTSKYGLDLPEIPITLHTYSGFPYVLDTYHQYEIRSWMDRKEFSRYLKTIDKIPDKFSIKICSF